MKKLKLILLLVLIVIVAFSSNLQAFWWLFGRTQNEVYLSYLYLNGLSFDESGEQVTFYRDFLEDGMINIRGRAAIAGGEIGSVMISIDGQETWHDAELSRHGVFEYSFRPQIEQRYEIYVEAMETAGRTNEVEETFKAVTVSNMDYVSLLDNTLDELFSAYIEQNIADFMEYVSWNFVGGDMVLEQALRSDFNNLGSIEISYEIVNTAVDKDGRIFSSIAFNRRVISSRTGATFTDRGITEFTFSLTDKGPKLYSMKMPLIFGISDWSNLATGKVESTENEENIITYETGDVGKEDIKDLDDTFQRKDENIQTGEITLQSEYPYGTEAYHFDTGLITDGTGMYGSDEGILWIGHVGVLELYNGYELNEFNLNAISEVPENGYGFVQVFELGGLNSTDSIGECFAVKTAAGNYAIIQITDVKVTQIDTYIYFYPEITFSYKYRDDGRRDF